MSWLRCVLCALLAIAAPVASAQTPIPPRAAVTAPTGRDIGIGAPWVSYYGNVARLDLARMANTFRLIDIDAFPDKILVMQNATGPATRHGITGGVAFASLLDGIAHEEVYAPTHDADVERELQRWSQLRPGASGRKLWIGTLDYAGGCGNAHQAKIVFARSRARGFSPSVSDASAGQNVVCYRGF